MPSTIDISPPVPFNPAYWVVPDRFMAGCYPGAEHSVDSIASAASQDRLRGLLEHGIRHIINLMEPSEANPRGDPFVPYESPLAAIARAMGCNVKFDRRPIRDYGIPTP